MVEIRNQREVGGVGKVWWGPGYLLNASSFYRCLMVAVTVVVVPVRSEEWPFRPSYNEVYPVNPPQVPPRPDVSATCMLIYVTLFISCVM